jgi:hypothetical protein
LRWGLLISDSPARVSGDPGLAASVLKRENHPTATLKRAIFRAISLQPIGAWNRRARGLHSDPIFCTVLSFPDVDHERHTTFESRRARRYLVKFAQLLPSKRRIGVWLRTHQLTPPKHARFRILIADLIGDDEALTHTRHLESALADQAGLAALPVGEGPPLIDDEIDASFLDHCRELIATHNGDSLIFGQTLAQAPRIRIRLVGRYEREAGRHGPYQMDWAELPKRFGPDVEGQLLALAALSVAPAAQGERDRAELISILRPAATKLTRLLENPSVALDSEQQGAFWHALGLAASLLGEHSDSERWLDVAVHAHRTALLIWQRDAVVFDWAIAQNNLGYALRLLAERRAEQGGRISLLKQAVDAFQEAVRVYRAAGAESYLRQSESHLARAEALLAERPIAAE